MITETFRIVSRNISKYNLDGFNGSLSHNDWNRGEGIFVESCECHPDRKRLIGIVFNQDYNNYDYFGIVTKKEFKLTIEEI